MPVLLTAQTKKCHIRWTLIPPRHRQHRPPRIELNLDDLIGACYPEQLPFLTKKGLFVLTQWEDLLFLMKTKNKKDKAIYTIRAEDIHDDPKQLYKRYETYFSFWGSIAAARRPGGTEVMRNDDAI